MVHMTVQYMSNKIISLFIYVQKCIYYTKYSMHVLGDYITAVVVCAYNYYVLAVKPAFGGLLCYGASSTAFRRKRSDASVYQEHF